MTHAVAETRIASAHAAELFRYGWRYIALPQPDGGEILEQVPLTIDDVLHPQEGDFVVQSDDHQRMGAYLYNVLRGLFMHTATTVVLHDTLVAWDVPGLRALSPDIAVIFGVRERRNWGTFDVATEGARPSLVIEVTSPATRAVDLSRKLDAYDIAGVPLYVVVDSYERKDVLARRLLGYRMAPQGLVGLAPDERGWIWMEPVGLWIGIRDNQVECYDRDGTLLEDYPAMLVSRAAAEARVAELEAELRRLRGDV